MKFNDEIYFRLFKFDLWDKEFVYFVTKGRHLKGCRLKLSRCRKGEVLSNFNIHTRTTINEHGRSLKVATINWA